MAADNKSRAAKVLLTENDLAGHARAKAARRVLAKDMALEAIQEAHPAIEVKAHTVAVAVPANVALANLLAADLAIAMEIVDHHANEAKEIHRLIVEVDPLTLALKGLHTQIAETAVRLIAVDDLKVDKDPAATVAGTPSDRVTVVADPKDAPVIDHLDSHEKVLKDNRIAKETHHKVQEIVRLVSLETDLKDRHIVAVDQANVREADQNSHARVPMARLIVATDQANAPATDHVSREIDQKARVTVLASHEIDRKAREIVLDSQEKDHPKVRHIAETDRKVPAIVHNDHRATRLIEVVEVVKADPNDHAAIHVNGQVAHSIEASVAEDLAVLLKDVLTDKEDRKAEAVDVVRAKALLEEGLAVHTRSHLNHEHLADEVDLKASEILANKLSFDILFGGCAAKLTNRFLLSIN